jgi:hypothetical protein
MKKLFSSAQSTELELFRNILADAGIVAEVRNGDVTVFPPPVDEELWVSDEDYPRAAELLTAWERPDRIASEAWTCPRCGERVEAQFSSCWKCGTEREKVS